MKIYYFILLFIILPFVSADVISLNPKEGGTRNIIIETFKYNYNYGYNNLNNGYYI